MKFGRSNCTMRVGWIHPHDKDDDKEEEESGGDLGKSFISWRGVGFDV